MAIKTFRFNDNEIVGDSGDRTNEMFVNLFKNNKSKDLIYIPNVGAIKKPNFSTPNAKKVFNYLWLTFINTPIF